MPKVTRPGVFETNSSSSHSLAVGSDDGPSYDEYAELNAAAQRLARALARALVRLELHSLAAPIDANSALDDYEHIRRMQEGGE